MMKGTFAVTREEGGMWETGRGASVHSIWFDDGSQWDSINGWRPRERPITFADRVDLIMAAANKKFDAVVPELFGARGLRDWQAQAAMNAATLFGRPNGIIYGGLFGGLFGLA